jgi:hypothetical protein
MQLFAVGALLPGSLLDAPNPANGPRTLQVDALFVQGMGGSA